MTKGDVRRNIMRTLAWVLMISSIASAAAPLTETERLQLVQRIQQSDANAMLEAGKSGDSALIPALEAVLQTRSNAVAKVITGREQMFQTEEARHQFLRWRDTLRWPEY